MPADPEGTIDTGCTTGQFAPPRAAGGSPVVIDGIPFWRMTESGCVNLVVAERAAGRGGSVLPVNVDVLRQLRRPDLRYLSEGGQVVVADGMPLIWASRLQGDPLPERVAGAALIWSLTAACAAAGLRIFLLGGAPGVAEKAAVALQSAEPGLIPVAVACPPYGFERDSAALHKMESALTAAAPDVVFVGLGFPKQEKLMVELASKFPAVWFVACGASITFVAGAVPRAPMWMQRSGLEWAYRLSQEPRRLARRYLVDDTPYLVGLLLRSARARRRRARG